MSDATSGSEFTPSELRDATFKSLRWLTIGRVAAECASVGAAIVLAHLIPPADFGRVAIATVVSELALALANEGTGSALVQAKRIGRAHVQSAALLALITGVTLALATFFLLPFVTTPLFGTETTELFKLFSPMFLIAAVGIVPLAMLERELDFRRISIIEISSVLSGAAMSIVLAIAGLDAAAYVLGTVFGMVVWAVLLVFMGPTALPRWHREEFGEIARFGLPAGLAGTAAVGYGNIDYSILGATMPAAQVGFYYRAFALGVQYQDKISRIITRLAFPMYSRTEDLDHMRAVRSRVVRINAALIVPLLALFIATAPDAVPWLFGSQWEPAVVPAQILAVAGMARMINNGTPPLVLAAGRPKALLWFNLYRVFVLAAVVLLAAPYGLVAVCIAVAAFQWFTLLASYAFMLNRLVSVDLKQLFSDVGPAFVSSAILIGPAVVLDHLLARSGVPHILEIGLVFVLAAPLYMLTLRVVSPPAWADVVLLARRVLLPSGGRKRKDVPLPQAAAPNA